MEARFCKYLHLIVFIKVCFTTDVISESLIYKNTSESHEGAVWENFFDDFDVFLEHTRIIDIIDGSQALGAGIERDEVRDYFDYLVGYFMKKKDVPITLLRTVQGERCKKKGCLRVNFKDMGNTKKLIILTYGAIETFKESLYLHRWSIYKRCYTSFFIIVMMDNGKEYDCAAKTSLESLKRSLSTMVDDLWKGFNIIDIFIVLPRFCGKSFILVFDPLRECTNGGCLEVYEKNTGFKAVLMHMNKNFRKFPLKVNVFHRNPTLLNEMPQTLKNSYLHSETTNLNTMAGVDAFIWGNLIKYLNFSVTLQTPSDDTEYGYMVPNGTFTGSLGDVVYRRSDLSINARFVRLYGTDDIEFTQPIYSDEFCLIVPKSKKIPYWLSIFLVFKVSTWGVIAATAMFLSLVWWIFKTKLPSTKEGPRGFMIVLDMLLLIISKPVKPPVLHGERILIFAGLIFNLVFAATFQGYLMTAYSTTSYYEDMDTLKDVMESGLPIMASNSIGDLFVANISPVMDTLITRTVNLHVPLSSFDRSAKIVIERSLDAKMLIERYHTDEDGHQMLHLNKECPRYFYLAYIVRRGYPFLYHINRYIVTVSEAGLIKKWYDQTEYSLMLKHRFQRAMNHPNFFVLNMEDVQTAFILLAVGYVIAIAVFAMEHLGNIVMIKRMNRIR